VVSMELIGLDTRIHGCEYLIIYIHQLLTTLA
jgi:hypothetical protein